MSLLSLNEIGERGVVVYDGTSFSYVLEDHWRDFKIAKPGQDLIALASANVVVASVARCAAVFLNLTEMNDVNNPSAPGASTGTRGTEDGPLVILHESGSFFSLSEDQLTSLEEGAEGDAGVLINRGTIAASIPQNEIPSGTWCILLNLASLVKRHALATGGALPVGHVTPARKPPKTAEKAAETKKTPTKKR
jgi:hypothetical protein